jgi:hypothetical protein
MPTALELPMEVKQLENGRWAKPCSRCKKEQTYLRRNYAIMSFKLEKLCKACSNNITENSHRGWYRNIRISWFNKFKASAELRNLEWSLSMDDVVDVMEEQDSKCALTGWDITFPESGAGKNISKASIDRIDSSKGYTKENIQLVIKQVNMMKQQYDQEEFVLICKAIAKKQSDKVKW